MTWIGESTPLRCCSFLLIFGGCKAFGHSGDSGRADHLEQQRAIGVANNSLSTRDGLAIWNSHTIESGDSGSDPGQVENSACAFRYSERPSWVNRPHDPFLTSMVLADMNQDGTNDIVLASGGDVQKGHVSIVYTARPGEVAPPVWISKSTDYYTGLAVGDLNADGRLDIAASSYNCPSIKNCETDELVAAQIFLTEGQTLPVIPQKSLKGFRSRGVDLGDVNGDGLLDLALAVIDSVPSAQRVYFNSRSGIKQNDPWTSKSKHIGASVTTLDINLDGLLDVLYTGQTPEWGAVFYGELSGKQIKLATEAKVLRWDSGHGTVLALASDPLRKSQASKELELAVAFSSHYCQEEQCYAPVALAKASSLGLGWQGQTTGLAAVIRAADIDRDGDLDLLVGSWALPKDRPNPGPVTLFCGLSESLFDPRSENLGGVPLGGCDPNSCKASPGSCTSCFLAQSLVLGNLHRDRLETRLHTESLASGGTTITLPDRLIDHILEVRRGDSQLRESQYLFVPGSNRIQIASELGAPTMVSVCYRATTTPDILVADANDADRIPVFSPVLDDIGHAKDGVVSRSRNAKFVRHSMQKSCAELGGAKFQTRSNDR